MSHSLYRRTALALWAPALALVLAACGSTAINSDYTPGPSNNAVGVAPGNPTSAATMHASKSAHPTKHATGNHSAPAKTSSSSPASSSGSHKTTTTSHKSGGTRHTASPCVWQAGSPSILVTQCTGLTSGQTITIQGRGFDPNKPVLAVECMANATGQSACNLPKGLSLLNLPKTWRPNADKTVTIPLKVVQSFNGYTCSAATPCIVSIASTDQSEDPSAPISFG